MVELSVVLGLMVIYGVLLGWGSWERRRVQVRGEEPAETSYNPVRMIRCLAENRRKIKRIRAEKGQQSVGLDLEAGQV